MRILPSFLLSSWLLSATCAGAEVQVSPSTSALLAADAPTQLQGYNAILQERQRQINELLSIARLPGDGSDKTAYGKALTYKLLGEMKATEAIGLLTDNILFYNKYGNQERAFSTFEDYYPCANALAEIGAPAIPAMLQSVESPTSSAKARASATWVIVQIEGAEQATVRLQQRLAKSTGVQQLRLWEALHYVPGPTALPPPDAKERPVHGVSHTVSDEVALHITMAENIPSGQPVTANFQVLNQSKHQILCEVSSGLDDWTISIRDSWLQPVPLTRYGHRQLDPVTSSTRFISFTERPGTVASGSLNLTKMFDLSEAGTYQVTFSVHRTDLITGKNLKIESAPIVFTVLYP